jgi:hypothetical protein
MSRSLSSIKSNLIDAFLSPIPHTRSDQKLYFIKDANGWKWPIGQSMTHGSTMLAVFRGTMYVRTSRG